MTALRAVLVVMALAAPLVMTVRLVIRSRGVPPHRRLAYLLFPLSQFSIVAFLMYYIVAFDLPLWVLALLCLASVLCMFADFAMFRALKDAEDKELEEERVRILEQQMRMQCDHRARLEADVREARSVRSELAAELQRVDALLVRQETSRAVQQVGHAAQLMGRADGRICEHRAVDALLTAKERVCGEQGIHLDVRVELADDTPLADAELCALFSNIMDNAIAACVQVSEGKRFVELRAHVDSGFLVVEARNSCTGEDADRVSEAKLPRAVHRPGEGVPEHGWGLTILQALADRHDGMLETERAESVFRTMVIVRV